MLADAAPVQLHALTPSALLSQVHFGASELADGVTTAGTAVLDTAAWPFLALKRQITKARNSGTDDGSGDTAPLRAGAPLSARRAGREAKEALLPDGSSRG